MRTASWIPLYRELEVSKGCWPNDGFEEEVIATRSAIFPDSVRDLEKQLQWNDLNLSFGNRPEVTKSEYLPARLLWSHRVEQDDEFADGEFLVFEHQTTSGRTVLVSPDLICALGLEMHADAWVYPREGYTEVIRFERDAAGLVCKVDIRAKHMKDYLCARKSQLAVATFRHRKSVQSTKPQYNYGDTSDDTSWYEFGYREIDERGDDYGVPLGVSIVGYSDTDHDDDVPTYGFDETKETWTAKANITSQGQRRYLVGAEMVLVESVPPAKASPIVRRDEIPANTKFIVDNDDQRQNAADLIQPPYGWTWFSPSLIRSVLAIPRTQLRWLTENTGMLSIPAHQSVHFGVNDVNLVNLFGKDIGELPIWWQERFVSHNVAPDGGVAAELIAAQMESRPATTTAPEARLFEAVRVLDEVASRLYGSPLFMDHQAAPMLWRNVHRFASTTEEEFYDLAKEVVRVVIERLDMGLLKSQTSEMDKSTGSIRRLAAILDRLGHDGRSATTVLVGLNELRQRDSHLPSEKDLDNAYQMARVDRSAHAIIRGKTLLAAAADCLTEVAAIIGEASGQV
jgi:hypothetical protein